MSLFSHITIGQYYPGNSPVHRLDPRAKLLGVTLLVAAGLLAKGTAGYLAAGFPVVAAIVTAGIPLSAFWRGMRALWVILLISLVLQTVFYPGEILWQWGIVSVSREGLISGGKLFYRLALLVLMGTLLTMTTTPVLLTGGLERLLQPLKKFGLPAHELAMMMTIALRFVPTLMEEAEAVLKAQQARGGSLYAGPLGQRLKAAVALLVPLLAGSLRRAEELATAMEARCYRGDIKRTRLKQLKYGGLDFAVLILISFSVITVVVDRWV